MAKLIKKPRSWVMLGVLVVLLLVPTFIKSNYILQILLIMFLYSYWASCWNIIGGYAGQFALGNGLYIGVGAYAAGIGMLFNISPWISMWIGALVAVLIAVAVSSLCFRLSGTYFALATVAFLYVARYIMLGQSTFFGVRTGAGQGMMLSYRGGLEWMQFRGKAPYYYILLIMLVVILLVSNYIRTHKIGVYLSAIKTNQGAASTIGINVVRYKMYAQIACAFFMALSGSVYACYLMTVDPYTVLGYNLSLEIMMYVVIGGMGTLWGPVLGGATLALVNQVLRVQFSASMSSLSLVAYGIILCIVVLFAPNGLGDIFSSLANRVKNWMTTKKKGGASA